MIENEKFNIVYKSIKKLITKCQNDVLSLSKEHRWDLSNDVRILPLNRFTNILLGFNLSFYHFVFPNEEVIESEFDFPEPKDEFLRNLKKTNEMLLKSGFVTTLFSIMETSLTSLYSEHFPDKKTPNLRTMCHELIKDLFDEEVSKLLCNSFNIFRLIRNSLHNNGIHKPLSQAEKNIIIPYQNNDYEFNYGKRIDFVSWELLINLANDFRKLLLLVSTSEDFVNKVGLLQDNY